MITVSANPPVLRVLQWNTLADQLAKDFPHVPDDCLLWSFRLPLIRAELMRVNADVLCLEEVDHYEDFLQPLMREQGYEGVFQKKPGWHRDGTAIFYRTSLVEVQQQRVESFEGQSQFLLLLECKYKPASLDFVVVAIHLKSKPEFEENRLTEARVLLEALERYGTKPIILAGDFNSTPSQQVYPLLSNSPLHLQSAYYNTINAGSEPDYTSHKYRKQLVSYTIDYIWVRGWSTSAVLSIPTPDLIGPSGLPSANYPSDHFAIVADLSLQVASEI
jgi:nocturnin